MHVYIHHYITASLFSKKKAGKNRGRWLSFRANNWPSRYQARQVHSNTMYVLVFSSSADTFP